MIDELSEIGSMVYIEAETLYRKMGYAEDFRLRYLGLHMVTFGNDNQIRWSPHTGFELDSLNCTVDFAEKWYQINSTNEGRGNRLQHDNAGDGNMDRG